MEKNTIWVDRITKGWKTAEEIVESINYLTECLMKLHDEDFQLLEQMEEELEEKQDRIEDLEHDNRKLEEEVDSKTEIIEELENEREELEDRKLSLEVRVEDLESEVESLEYHIEEMRGRR